MTRTPLKRFPLLRRKLGSVMSNYVQGTYNQALPVFFFCSCSDFPDSCSTPNKQKRKGSVLGLDPQDLNLKSPSKRACKKHSPLPAPAKQVKRCGKNSSEPHFFFPLLVLFFACLVCLCMHSPELEMVPVSPFHIPSKPWTAEITPVDLGWRIEKCSRFSLELNKENLFSDEPPFMLSQNTPPYKTLPVDMDGNCFFRYTVSISFAFATK